LSDLLRRVVGCDCRSILNDPSLWNNTRPQFMSSEEQYVSVVIIYLESSGPLFSVGQCSMERNVAVMKLRCESIRIFHGDKCAPQCPPRTSLIWYRVDLRRYFFQENLCVVASDNSEERFIIRGQILYFKPESIDVKSHCGFQLADDEEGKNMAKFCMSFHSSGFLVSC